MKKNRIDDLAGRLIFNTIDDNGSSHIETPNGNIILIKEEDYKELIECAKECGKLELVNKLERLKNEDVIDLTAFNRNNKS